MLHTLPLYFSFASYGATCNAPASLFSLSITSNKNLRKFKTRRIIVLGEKISMP